MNSTNEMFYRSAAPDTVLNKYIPIIFASLFTVLGMFMLLVPSAFSDTNTGTPVPWPIALIFTVVSLVWLLVGRMHNRSLSYIEFYEKGIRIPEESGKLISWSEVEKVRITPFTFPQLHKLYFRGEAHPRKFEYTQDAQSFGERVLLQSYVTVFVKRMLESGNEES